MYKQMREDGCKNRAARMAHCRSLIVLLLLAFGGAFEISACQVNEGVQTVNGTGGDNGAAGNDGDDGTGGLSDAGNADSGVDDAGELPDMAAEQPTTDGTGVGQ